MKNLLFIFSGICFLIACTTTDNESWQLGPFSKYDGNPIIAPQGSTWESKDVFNPAAWSDGKTIYILYRAEDSTGIGEWNGTSRIGLAESTDGFHFQRHDNPVFGPEEEYELPGGTEDPRIVKIDGTFYLTYTAYDGETARLAMASSKDLFNWERHGILFPDLEWSKSGAIIPQQINGRYWMYFGDTNIWVAWSEDMVNWTRIDEPVMEPREDKFDSRLIEPGPTPVITDAGILLLYNSADEDLIYRTGQALFDISDPTRLLDRSEESFLTPDTQLETEGQIPNVVFIEGLVQLNSTWFLYFGMGDS